MYDGAAKFTQSVKKLSLGPKNLLQTRHSLLATRHSFSRLFSEFRVNIRGKEYAVVYNENGNYKVDFNLLLFFIGRLVKVLFDKSETGISEIRKISLMDHNPDDDLSNLYFRASFEYRKAFVAEIEKVANDYRERLLLRVNKNSEG